LIEKSREKVAKRIFNWLRSDSAREQSCAIVACALIVECALRRGGGEEARKLHKFCTGIGRYADAGRV